MRTSPNAYHGGRKYCLSNAHAFYSPVPTFSPNHCTIEALHHRRRCDLFSASGLHYESSVVPSPMAYDFPSQSTEFSEKQHRPGSAGCTTPSWTTVAALSPPFSDSQSAVLVSSGSTPDGGSAVLTSVSTPSIGFEGSTPTSALSFPSPALFSVELSSIQQCHSTSDPTRCSTPTASSLQCPLLSSTSSDDSSIPWSNHNLSITCLSAAQLSSSNSLLTHSDPISSDSSCRSWTPDQTESFHSPSGLPELHRTSRQPTISLKTSTESLPFGSDRRKSLPSPRSKPNTARFLINQTNASSVIQTSLSSHPSIQCEDMECFIPSPSFPPNATYLCSQSTETAPQLCNSFTPLPVNPMGARLKNNTASNFSMSSTWFQPNRFVHMAQYQGHSKYDCTSNNHASFTSRNFSPCSDAIHPQPPQALGSPFHTRSATSSQFPPPLVPTPSCVEKDDESGNGLLGVSGHIMMEPTASRNVQHPNKSYQKKKREVREVEATCGVCGQQMAWLTLRGSLKELYVADGFELVHTCKLCQEGRPRDASLAGSPVSIPAPFSGPNFVNSVTCQQYELLHPQPIPQSAITAFRKRNRRADDVTAPITCDCCARQLGVGGIVPWNGRSAIQFVVEVVCMHCNNNFRRCTDCGGGGGSRLGVGKWRCKELFSDGRRTCILSHQRQGASNEVVTTIWNIKDLADKPELETLVAQINELVKYSLYAALAIPEILESGLARVARFDDIKTMYSNGWKRVEPLIRKDIESSSDRRRYIGLRWTKPHPRKGPKRVDTNHDNCSPAGSPSAEDHAVIQPGKELSGFVLSEWDMQNGTFFISVAMPWQSGNALELTTALANKSLLRAKSDREKLINDAVHRGGMSCTEAALRYPPIRHLFTLLFFHRDARLVQFLEKRRKFMPLEEYLSRYPDARREFFPPHRDCYVPTEEQYGWNVWVQRQNGNKATIQT